MKIKKVEKSERLSGEEIEGIIEAATSGVFDILCIVAIILAIVFI